MPNCMKADSSKAMLASRRTLCGVDAYGDIGWVGGILLNFGRGGPKLVRVGYEKG